MTVGQLIGKVKTTFPFIPWRMYSRAEIKREAVFYELIGQDQTGQRITINPAHLFPTLAHGRLSIGIDNLMRDIKRHEKTQKQVSLEAKMDMFEESEETSTQADGTLKRFANTIRWLFKEETDLTLEQKKKHVNELLLALGNMYNRKHPHKPLKAIFLSRGTIDLNENPIADTVHAMIWRLELKDKRTP